ncbi:YhcN/YlaJ family sporulation lipoprotein [Falsibacillus pallidus]|uniref:YhcN/YlaJ family sporulation lipoprotein n=1 Tax=Falsibacillus pallidus TaxID=493781 RepID=A0A370GVS2_9BACI|nr:YhcN/YlaJ family sporulation lipoprotein [Falsibacillus pallidus]RDI47599.1 YhcN/YlaJ family sporulation lipoprotein [Falsibacillus pallidus]
MRYLSAIILIGLLTAGCSNINNNKEKTAVHDQQNEPRPISVQNSNKQSFKSKNGQQISKHLVNLASSIPNVNDATAVVLGKIAVVGIDIDSNVERSQVGSIKYSVAESLKNDPYGANAVIVADPDLVARLKEVKKDIGNGKPIQGIMNELSDIVGRVMPEIPGTLSDTNPEQAPENPKKSTNDKNEKQLEKDQEKQSNYHK